MSSSSKLLCFCSIKINSPSWLNTLQPPCIASIYLFEGAFMVWFWILTWHLATYVSNLSGVLFSILRGSLAPSQMFLNHLKQTHKLLPLCNTTTMPQKIWFAGSVKTQNFPFPVILLNTMYHNVPEDTLGCKSEGRLHLQRSDEPRFGFRLKFFL